MFDGWKCVIEPERMKIVLLSHGRLIDSVKSFFLFPYHPLLNQLISITFRFHLTPYFRTFSEEIADRAMIRDDSFA